MLNIVKKVLLKRSFERQRTRAARDLSLWDLEVNRQGHLSIGGLDAIELLQKCGSPAFGIP
jgi:hypothetical protein